MIYLSFALYHEAKPFIKKYKLKKDINIHKFQVFSNSDVRLIITGTGMISSIMGVTYLLTEFKANDKDLFANIGVCAANRQDLSVGDTVLCNKIIYNWNKKCSYPDILFNHTFKEASLETTLQVIDKPSEDLIGDIIDMEAAGIFKAASLFIPVHRMFFIKVVSDKFDQAASINGEIVHRLMDNACDDIIYWLNNIYKYYQEEESVLDSLEYTHINSMKNNLMLTEAMIQELIKILVYYKLRKGNIEEAIEPYINLKCKDKNEGKKFFGELRHKLMDC